MLFRSTLEEIAITSEEFSKLTAAENQEFDEAEVEEAAEEIEEIEEEKDNGEEEK